MTSEKKGCDAAKRTATTTDTKAGVATKGARRRSILTRSKPFQKMVDKVFKGCDTSNTGTISKSELYVGLLKVHITLARYAGPAALFVSTRKCKGTT